MENIYHDAFAIKLKDVYKKQNLHWVAKPEHFRFITHFFVRF